MKYSNVFEFKRELSAYRPTYVVGNDKLNDPLPKINVRASSKINIAKKQLNLVNL